MTEDSKKIILKYHSTIRIEHPSTTWLGRIAQKRRIRKGEIHILEHFELSTSVARELFPWLPNARRIPDNAIEPGRDHAFFFSVYTVEYQGRTIEFKCKLTDGELIYNMRFI